MSKTIDILVIDDEQVIRDAVRRVCETAGLTVETASDGPEGLTKVRSGSYRVVLCDVMLPELDAFHILESMNQAGIFTPVIMITGFSTVENAVNALKSGAVDFIPKPFTADELESAVRRALRYQDFPRSEATRGFTIDSGTTFHIPSPASYHSLGNLSWAFVEPTGSSLIGMTDLYLKTISPLKEIHFFEIDSDLVQGSLCARILSGDRLIHDVLSPLSGRILEQNEGLLSDPERAEKDPYFDGWLYRIIPQEMAYELERLTPSIQEH